MNGHYMQLLCQLMLIYFTIGLPMNGKDIGMNIAGMQKVCQTLTFTF